MGGGERDGFLSPPKLLNIGVDGVVAAGEQFSKAGEWLIVILGLDLNEENGDKTRIEETSRQITLSQTNIPFKSDNSEYNCKILRVLLSANLNSTIWRMAVYINQFVIY